MCFFLRSPFDKIISTHKSQESSNEHSDQPTEAVKPNIVAPKIRWHGKLHGCDGSHGDHTADKRTILKHYLQIWDM